MNEKCKCENPTVTHDGNAYSYRCDVCGKSTPPVVELVNCIKAWETIRNAKVSKCSRCNGESRLKWINYFGRIIYYIECSRCGVSSNLVYETLEEVVHAWNNVSEYNAKSHLKLMDCYAIMNATGGETIAPCPACEGQAIPTYADLEDKNSFDIVCTRCQHTKGRYESIPEAIKQWNTVAELVKTDDLSMMEEYFPLQKGMISSITDKAIISTKPDMETFGVQWGHPYTYEQ